MLRRIKDKAKEVIPDALWSRMRGCYHKLVFYLVYFDLGFIKKRALNGPGCRTILFYPDVPLRFHEMSKLCGLLGYGKTNDLGALYDLAFHWQDTTFAVPDERLTRLADKRKIVNIRCRDISKKRVDEVFREVFGYGLMINPLTFSGKCCKKSDLNAKDAEAVLECPLGTAEGGFVYQKLINNTVDNGLIQDISVPVLGDRLPFAYLKFRYVDNRFHNCSLAIEIVELNEVVSEQEKQKILVFCEKIGLDYGELDMIRDVDDKRLYVIDINSTPIGPWGYVSPLQRVRALKKTAEAFEGFLDDLVNPGSCRRAKGEDKRFHLVYFSCSKHFEYLFVSLRSLEKLGIPSVKRIYIAVDRNDPLTEAQESALKRFLFDIELLRCDHVTGFGKQTLVTEIKILKEVGEKIPPEDYIAKVDSDTVFISGRVFGQVLRSDGLFIGQKETFWEPIIYVQGGCYFLKGSLARDMDTVDVEDAMQSAIDDIINKSKRRLDWDKWVYMWPGIYPEDACMSYVIRKKTDDIRYIDFQFRHGASEEERSRWEISVVHAFGSLKDRIADMGSAMEKDGWRDYEVRLGAVSRIMSPRHLSVSLAMNRFKRIRKLPSKVNRMARYYWKRIFS